MDGDSDQDQVDAAMADLSVDSDGDNDVEVHQQLSMEQTEKVIQFQASYPSEITWSRKPGLCWLYTSLFFTEFWYEVQGERNKILTWSFLCIVLNWKICLILSVFNDRLLLERRE